jgi:molybdopterin synthase catalytic subunit
MEPNGVIHVTITHGPLARLRDAQADLFREQGVGALVYFEGIIRPIEDNRPIEGIEYEVYEPMAQNTLTDLAAQAIAEFGVLAITVEHSKGTVPKFECSFRLQVASAHRKEGLAAVDWFIETMKRDVPIWKHMQWADHTPSTKN